MSTASRVGGVGCVGTERSGPAARAAPGWGGALGASYGALRGWETVGVAGVAPRSACKLR
jgi:hypothetical protein